QNPYSKSLICKRRQHHAEAMHARIGKRRMNLDRYTAEEIGAHEQQLLARLPPDATVGNVTLRSQLGWSKSHYWDIRNYLIDRGVLASGRGKGGSVRLIPQAVTGTMTAPSMPAVEATTAGLSEADAICMQYPDEQHLYQ